MKRRHFLAAPVLAGAFSFQARAARLPIRKGILLGMLPRALSVDDKFKLAKDCGFQSIEIGTEDDPAKVNAIGEASKKTGVPVHSVMNRDHWQFPLSSGNPEVVEKSVKGMETSISNAKALGAETVLLVPAVVNPETSYQDAWTRSQKIIRERLLPLAERQRVIIAVEEVWNKFLLSPLEFAKYVDDFQSPWVKAYVDVGNMMLFGYPQDWIRTLNKRIVKLHFKDFTFRRNPELKKNVADWVNLRDGDVPWKEVHKALAEIGYKGDATLEVQGGDEAFLRDLSSRFDQILEGV